MKNKIFIAMMMTLMCCIIATGCTKSKETEVENSQNTIGSTPSTNIFEEESENKVEQNNNEMSSKDSTTHEMEKKYIEMNYKEYFGETTGCMVIYDEDQGTYNIYNSELVDYEASPCSTFKIVSGLIGIEEGVIASSETKMNYNGNNYGMDQWNEDLAFKEAFQCSCVWYFKKVLEQVGSDKVAKYIKDLNYGNGDLSEWDGSGINPTPDTNGFWLESSLMISPIQQVEVLANIFEGKTNFSDEGVTLMKEIMQVEKNDHYMIYGKTGTGRNNAWFVGFFEKDNKHYYFATRLVGDESHNVSGNIAKEITLHIVDEMD